MTVVKSVYVSSVSTQDYEPFMVEGKQIGEVHWLRDSGSGEGMLMTGLWRCEPATFDYAFPADETFQVLEGELTIAFTGGETIQLEPGDIASFAKGTESVWTITAQFKKFFVESG